MSDNRIILDVEEDWPGGFPRKGDKVVVWPDENSGPVAFVRYLGPEGLDYVQRHLHLMTCTTKECHRCTFRGNCPLQALRVLD